MSMDYEYIVKHLPQPVLLIDSPTQRIIEANQAAIELYEYSLSEFIELTVLDIHPREERQKYLLYNQELTHRKETFSRRWRHQTKSGNIIYVNIKAHKFEREPGKPTEIAIIENITLQVYQEEEIARREYLLSSLIDSQSSYLIRIDLEGKYTFVNTVFFEKYGNHQAILGELFTNTILKDEATIFQSAFEYCLKVPGHTETAILCMPLKNNVMSWVEWDFIAIKTPEGTIEEIQGVGRDITQRKKAQDLLLANQDKLNSIMQAMQIGVIQVDLNGNIDFANQKAGEIFDIEPNQMIGNHYADNSRWEIVDNHLKAIKVEDYPLTRTLKAKQPFSNLEYGILNKQTQEIKWLSSTGTPILDEHSTINGALINFSDITEIKDTERELKKSYQNIKNFKQALENSTILSITNLKGEILEVNDAFLKVSKYKEKDIIGKDHNILNSDYHSKAFFEEMWCTIKKGNTWRGELRNEAKDSSEYWIDCIINPIRDENNRVYRYLSIGYLITGRKKAELRLKELNEGLVKRNKQLLDFAFVTSHELRRPLANIMGLVELFNYDDLSDKFNAEIIKKLEQSSNELDAVVHDMNQALHEHQLTENDES